jgi:hypothetical protein
MRIQIRSRTLLFIFFKTFFVFIEVYFYKTRTFFLLLLAVCRSQDGVGGVMDVGEEPTAGAVPPAPVPGAAPAIRQPASTGQCPTCSRPRGRRQPSASLHQQVSVPPAPVPGAAPAIRPPASTGQCPTCSRPRGGSSHPPACINRSVSHLLPSPGRLRPPSCLHQQVSVAPKSSSSGSRSDPQTRPF